MAKIRKLIANDIPRAAEILSESVPWMAGDGSREAFEELLQGLINAGSVFVVEENGQLSGLACFVCEPILAGGGCLRFIAVREEARTRNIHRHLMGFVERRVFAKSESLFLSIPGDDEPAVRFFVQLGYHKVAEVRDVFRFGRTEWILRKVRKR